MVFGLEHISESAGGLVKTDCWPPTLEFLIQYFLDGAQEFHKFSGDIDVLR